MNCNTACQHKKTLPLNYFDKLIYGTFLCTNLEIIDILP